MTSCYDVTKKVRGSLGRVTETVATTAGSNAVLLGKLRDRGGLGGTEAETITGTFYIMKL